MAYSKIPQEEYDKAEGNIATFKEGRAEMRFNADKPIAAMVDAQIVFAEKLVEAKTRKTTLIARVISRCNGPWRPVVWLFDSTTCNEYRNM